MEGMIATVGNNALIIGEDKAAELSLEIAMLLRSAEECEVNDSKSNEDAADLKKRISKMKKTVEAEYEPYRLETKAKYDAVLAAKKEMTTPLDKAEKTVSKEISNYAYEVEKRRRAEEAARQKALEAAMMAKLEEAAKAETEGDAIGAEMAMAEAEVFDGMNAPAAEPPKKVDGMSQKIGWEIVAMDAKAVPVYIRAADGRFIPVQIGNKAVVESLVRQAIETEKGNISIPGVAFRETMKVSVR